MATLNPNLKSFWKTRELEDGTPVVGRVLHGGRMSSKSHDVAGVAIAQANHHQEVFLCTRMFQNRIADSVYSLLVNKIDYFGLGANFKIYSDAIEHKKNGSLFRFYGIARNITEIKSFEGATKWWNEESHNLTKEMFQTIRPTVMRNEAAEMWFTFNPQYINDYSYQRLVVNPPKGFLVRQINYLENPFLEPSALRDIEAEFEEDYEEASHIYLGHPRTDDDKVIIKLSWVEAAIGFDLDDSGRRVVGYDVADEGEDSNATMFARGSRVYHADMWNKMDTTESARRVYADAMSHGCEIVYDSIGVGAGAKGEFNSIAKSQYQSISAVGFNAGGAVAWPNQTYKEGKTNKEHFANVKAQAWFMLADRFYNTYRAAVYGDKFEVDQLISLSPDLPHLEQLKFELTAPRREYDRNMRVKVESKKDMKKRGIKSPNLADALVMCYAPTTANDFSGLL